MDDVDNTGDRRTIIACGTVFLVLLVLALAGVLARVL